MMLALQEDSPKVTIKSRTGGREYVKELDKIHARDIEEHFRKVRCHLEGDDNSAIFPNKQTGQYRKLSPKVTYYVFGHEYNEDEVWKPTAKFEKGKIDIPTDGSIIKEGYLDMKVDTWWGFGTPKINQYWFTICYNKLKWYESKSASADPKGEIEIEDSTRVQIAKEMTNAFQIITPLEILFVIAKKHEDREEWMALVEAIRETETKDDDKEEDD